jgi:hypothetical protein
MAEAAGHKVSAVHQGTNLFPLKSPEGGVIVNES